MKRYTLLLGLTLLVFAAISQSPDMRTKLVYNANDCRYEVYATPSSSVPVFNMGGSQIIVAVPHDAIVTYPTTRRSAFSITTVTPSTSNWSVTAFADKDQSATYSGSFDYYAVDNDGGPLGVLTANQDILLFHFSLGHNCINGLRLWEGAGAVPNNNNDPKYPLGGGDFQTNISDATSLPFSETWVGNSTNTPTLLPLPTAALTTQDDFPATGLLTITASGTGGAGCGGYSYQWSGTGSWLIAPGTSNFGVANSPGMGAYTVNVKDANGCQDIATVTLPLLPVELISFTVTKENTTSLLKWETATEVNNSYFDVEHSLNARDFSQIGRVFSKSGNSSSVQSYDYSHLNPQKGVNYYRLKQVDTDGSFEYSEVKSVTFGNSTGLIIYPNPAGDILQVVIPSDAATITQADIHNLAGQVIRSVTNPKLNGEILSVNVKDLATGYYFINIRTETRDIYREQFLIAR